MILQNKTDGQDKKNQSTTGCNDWDVLTILTVLRLLLERIRAIRIDNNIQKIVLKRQLLYILCNASHTIMQTISLAGEGKPIMVRAGEKNCINWCTVACVNSIVD